VLVRGDVIALIEKRALMNQNKLTRTGSQTSASNALTTCSESAFGDTSVGQDVTVCMTSSRSERVPGCSTESLNSHVRAMAEVAKAGRSAKERKESSTDKE
jgi:hypothetical protein